MQPADEEEEPAAEELPAAEEPEAAPDWLGMDLAAEVEAVEEKRPKRPLLRKAPPTG